MYAHTGTRVCVYAVRMGRVHAHSRVMISISMKMCAPHWCVHNVYMYVEFDMYTVSAYKYM